MYCGRGEGVPLSMYVCAVVVGERGRLRPCMVHVVMIVSEGLCN